MTPRAGALVYGMRLMFQRSWVWILYTGWSLHLSHLIVVKIIMMCVWKDENKRKRGQGWSNFLKNWRQILTLHFVSVFQISLPRQDLHYPGHPVCRPLHDPEVLRAPRAGDSGGPGPLADGHKRFKHRSTSHTGPDWSGKWNCRTFSKSRCHKQISTWRPYNEILQSNWFKLVTWLATFNQSALNQQVKLVNEIDTRL